MSKKKKLLTVLIPILVVVAALAIGLGVYFGYSQPYADMQTYTVGDGRTLKIGVLSDSQLPAAGEESKWTENLQGALQNMKNKDVDVLVLAGDFTDQATADAWKSFESVYKNVFGDDDVVPCFVMGNHDYWLPYFVECFEIPSPAKMQKRFEKYTGEKPYSHKVINGYHFIGWSSSDGSYDKSYTNVDWAREQIEIAIKDDPTKPVFVVTHLNPSNTVYGSHDGGGNDDIAAVLKDYPQVISLSGHSHFPLLDDRTMWQGDYTAINTQTIDYVCLEDGIFNSSYDVYGNDLSSRSLVTMLMTVDGEKVTVERMNAWTGETVKTPWIIDMPVEKSTFRYTDELREKTNAAPYFDDGTVGVITTESDNNGKPIKVLTFNTAKDNDLVHSYKLQFKDTSGNILSFNKTTYDGKEYLEDDKPVVIDEVIYSSANVFGVSSMPLKEKLRLVSNMPENTATITVTAIDSFGKESKPIEVKVK